MTRVGTTTPDGVLPLGRAVLLVGAMLPSGRDGRADHHGSVAVHPPQGGCHAPGAFLEEVRTIARLKHLSPSTEATYCQIIKRFILFHHKRHPASMGGPEIRAFLTYLAVEGRVAASTQTQALSALI